MEYQNIIDFWFDEKTKPYWFNSTIEFDNKLKDDYLSVYTSAQQLELDDWLAEPLGALALVIILDQYPLNMFRGLPESFATEEQSRLVAEKAIELGFDANLTLEQKAFLYMPFMHSENIADQKMSLALFNQEGLENNYKFAQHHYAIIEQFGRFPHRNKVLGRDSTDDEVKYLNSKEAFLG